MLKSTQQLVVAGARFVHARHDRIDAAQRRERSRCGGSPSRAGPNGAVSDAPQVPAPARPLCRRQSPDRRDPARSINAAVEGGMLYGSSSGSSRSSSVSPVDEMPAAWVRVAKAAPRARSTPIAVQSRINPADGASNATGRPANRVHDSQMASGSRHVRCTGWGGRGGRDPPRCPPPAFKRISISRGCARTRLPSHAAAPAAVGRRGAARGGAAGPRSASESRRRRRQPR